MFSISNESLKIIIEKFPGLGDLVCIQSHPTKKTHLTKLQIDSSNPMSLGFKSYSMRYYVEIHLRIDKTLFA